MCVCVHIHVHIHRCIPVALAQPSVRGVGQGSRMDSAKREYVTWCRWLYRHKSHQTVKDSPTENSRVRLHTAAHWV